MDVIEELCGEVAAYMEQARGRPRPRARCFDRAARITFKPDRPPKIGSLAAINSATFVPPSLARERS